MRFFNSLFAILLCGASISVPAALPAPIKQALRQLDIPVTSASLWVGPADGTRPLVQYRAQEAVNPASVMKLLTSYAALDLLGPQHIWETNAYTDAPVLNGILDGDIILQGSGDPVLSWDKLDQWLREIRSRGLRQINGDLLLDRTLFLEKTEDPGAFDERPLRAYNAGPEAFLVNFKALTLRLAPNEASSEIDAVTQTPFEPLIIENNLTPVAGPCYGWKDALNLHVEWVGQELHVRLRGHYAQECGEKLLHIAIHNGPAFAAGIFRALWHELGGQWQGNVRQIEFSPADEGLKLPLSVWRSPPLNNVLRDMNKFSNNLIARQIFLTLGTLQPSSDAGGHMPRHVSTEQAAFVIHDWLMKKHLMLPHLVLENGSGLSHNERITAEGLASLLKDAWKSPRMPDFVASLPIVGMDGTVKKHFTDDPLTGQAYLKTGTLNDVKATAGYVLDARGKWQVLVFVVNHPRAEYTGAAQDAAIQWAYSRGRTIKRR